MCQRPDTSAIEDSGLSRIQVESFSDVGEDPLMDLDAKSGGLCLEP
jgi:hypothetical protein